MELEGRTWVEPMSCHVYCKFGREPPSGPEVLAGVRGRSRKPSNARQLGTQQHEGAAVGYTQREQARRKYMAAAGTLPFSSPSSARATTPVKSGGSGRKAAASGAPLLHSPEVLSRQEDGDSPAASRSGGGAAGAMKGYAGLFYLGMSTCRKFRVADLAVPGEAERVTFVLQPEDEKGGRLDIDRCPRVVVRVSSLH